MAYALAYCVHTLEMNALRGWGVAFLAFVAARTGAAEGAFSPTLVVTALALIGTTASVAGNEMAIRLGRRRLVCTAMVLSIVFAAILGFVGSLSYAIAVALLLIYGAVVWLNSSSLTAGAAGTAEPSRRGATLAVHSMLGYGGGFVGPLAVGWTLDLGGRHVAHRLGTGLSCRRGADGAGPGDVRDHPAARARRRSGSLRGCRRQRTPTDVCPRYCSAWRGGCIMPKPYAHRGGSDAACR